MLDSERWRRIEQLFHSALEKPPRDRPAFLAQACEQDADLQRRVEILLAQTGPTEALIDRRAWQAATELTYSRTVLEPGVRLGPYEIVDLLGHGGMGSVYRAIDTRLDRVVAIKVTAEQFSTRFERETRAVSALNHPNICTLYDVGPDFLVMELVEGETLGERIGRVGPLPVKEALDISLQIAEASEVAHAKGIVHCDLKPSNIKITPEGRVKVLDFGLARAIRDEQLERNDSLRTANIGQSVAGQVLGTPAYMSPEQARGDYVDERTDVWSFGCLLYELLTGKRAFPGETSSEIIDAIWEREPDWQRLPSSTSITIRRLLQECLEKDTTRRLHDIRTARSAIEMSMRRKPASTPRRAAGLGVSLAAIGLAWFLGAHDVTPNQNLHAVPLTTYLGSQDWPSLSPDGSEVAFSWDGEKQDNLDIYIKKIGRGQPVRLTRDPAPDRAPAWSPDGSTIAFLRGSRSGKAAIVLMTPSGEQEHVLTEVAVAGPNNQFLAWSPDSKWVAVSDIPVGQPPGIWLISVDTAERRRLTTVPQGALQDLHLAFAPKGRALAFTRMVANNSFDSYLLSLTENLTPRGEPRWLSRENQVLGLAWTPGGRDLIVSSGPPGNLSLFRISTEDKARRTRLTDQGETLNLTVSERSHRMVFSQSRREMDIYRAQLSLKGDEAFQPAPLIASSRLDRYPRYSPDGKKIAFVSLRSGNWQLWVSDSRGENPVQMTSFERAEVVQPYWSADGQRIGFAANPEGVYLAYTIDVGGGPPRKLEAVGADLYGWSWSRDGRWIFFPSSRSGSRQFWKIPAEGGEAEQMTFLGGDGCPPSDSPDSKFAYYARPGGVWSVPVEGGKERKLFAFDVDPGCVEVSRLGIYFVANSAITKGGELMFYRFPNGPITKVAGVETRYGQSVSPDGRYLLYTKMTSTGSDLMMIENFR